MRTRPSGRVVVVLAAMLLAAVATSACHDEGDVRVTSLKFAGNHAFGASQLERVMVTRASGWLPWSRPHFFNRAVFDEDLQRLQAFYDDRGYPDARVTSVDVSFNAARDAVRLLVNLDEGQPLIVDRIDFKGFEEVPEEVSALLEDLPQRAGQPRDRQAVSASRERATYILRDHGYAHARVVSSEDPGTAPKRVILTLTATPGLLTHFGDIAVVGLNSVEEDVVRRGLSFKPGELYRISLVTESQRRLGRLGIFDFAHVTGEPQAMETRLPQLPMVISVTEGKSQRIQFGGGWGSDGPRVSVKWEHLNFLSDARRLIGEGRYGKRLRGASLEFVEPHFFTSKWSLNARAGAWWTAEDAYTSRRVGGRSGVTYRRELSRGIDVEPIEHIVRVGYLHDSLRFTIDPATLADLSQFEQLIALGLDPVTGRGAGRLAALDLNLERIAVDHPADPHAGHTASLYLKHAAPWLQGTYRYDEVVLEGRFYIPLGDKHVWATRARVGTILAGNVAPVPVSERYFLGGSNNLRGWGRFQVAPLTKEGLPVGGRALLDLTTEVRLAAWGKFGAVAFVDAGNVWATPAEVSVKDLRVAAGPGVRWESPIGIVRADVGIQLTRIPGLKVSGGPEPRRWRIHFGIGHVF